MNLIRLQLGKWVLTLYRWTAVVLLYLVLFGVFSYIGMLGFFAVNSSWVAPLTISPSNDHILSLKSQLVQSMSQLNGLTTQNSTLLKTRTENLLRRTALVALDRQLDLALQRTKTYNADSGGQLATLAEQKKADLSAQRDIVNSAAEIEAAIDRDFKAGLITRAEMLQQKSVVNQYKNTYTDGRVNEVVLLDNAHQKTTNDDLAAVDAMSKKVEIQGEISAIDLQITTGDDQIKNNSVQIESLKHAIATTSGSPYFVVANADRPSNFAFVPYDNAANVAPGSKVYGCYMRVVFCYEAGTIKQVFTDEEKATNPVFMTDMRGFLVQMELKNPIAATSKTLFVNRKPLLF